MREAAALCTPDQPSQTSSSCRRLRSRKSFGSIPAFHNQGLLSTSELHEGFKREPSFKKLRWKRLVKLNILHLYTNISTEEGVATMATSFLRHTDTRRRYLMLLTMLHITVSRNILVFRWKQFLKTQGTAMGCVFSCKYFCLIGRITFLSLSSNVVGNLYCIFFICTLVTRSIKSWSVFLILP